jgi:hypothetical protein
MDPVATLHCTMRDARARYFEEASLGQDGGYSARWVRLKLGPISLAFPNTASRVRAVQYHDLHHVLTGYATDWVGECEIGAWEIASSCRGFVAAWILNLFAFSTGCLFAPARTFRAFVRGSSESNLYAHEDLGAVLDRELEEVRNELGLSSDTRIPSAADRLAFLTWSLVSIVHIAVWLFVLIGLPTIFVAAWLFPKGVF